MAKLKFNSSYRPVVNDELSLVYFDVDLKELFGVSITYPGMRKALRTAFRASRKTTPFKTGNLRRSYKMDFVSRYIVRMYFDKSFYPDSYYAAYLTEKPKTRLWLQILVTSFLSVLISEIENMNKDKEQALSLVAALLLLEMAMEEQEKRKKEAEEDSRNRRDRLRSIRRFERRIGE